MEHLTRMAEFEPDHRRPQTNCDSDSPCPDENCPRHFVRKVEYLLKAKGHLGTYFSGWKEIFQIPVKEKKNKISRDALLYLKKVEARLWY